jgi:hypothetical protein
LSGPAVGRAQITGIGETEYVRGTALSTEDLLLQAALLACADAGVEPTSVDGVVVPNGKLAAESFVHALGITDLRFHAANAMGGASTAAAIMIAAAAVISGQASRAPSTAAPGGSAARMAAPRRSPGQPRTCGPTWSGRTG